MSEPFHGYRWARVLAQHHVRYVLEIVFVRFCSVRIRFMLNEIQSIGNVQLITRFDKLITQLLVQMTTNRSDDGGRRARVMYHENNMRFSNLIIPPKELNHS